MASILELPEDILLELAKELDVVDLVSFLSTCRVIRKVKLHKSLWLDALVRIQEVERQPHPLSNTQNLSTLSLQQLQHTAQQINRLMKNWRSDNPRPTRIGQLSVEPNYGFFCLTGTPFIVTHADAEGSMSCWDIRDAKRVAHLELPGLVRADIRLWAVGDSGTYVLLLVAARSSSDGEEYLGLLHFSAAPTPRTTFRKLDIGNAATRLESVSRMALDDALGTIFLLDAEGNKTG
ncbi:hypothetical protein B0H16DRAFT_1780760 [Mycena metata]|uniref:F-box domain-containing protein n=1 Tax=Mycena metata TaxID=1033252 RepID=A0AAD7MNX6_9AGAR|nr:hypothetical protein B0H16DRAFT_1780760 [Mycena metata]